MRTTSMVLLVAVLLCLGGAAAAWADTCYQDGNGNLYVLKNFTQPGTPNACNNINGYLAFSPCSLSGNACRTDDGGTIAFQAQSSFVFCNFEVVWTVDASGSGQLLSCPDANPGSCTPTTVNKVVCPTIRPFGFGPAS